MTKPVDILLRSKDGWYKMEKAHDPGPNGHHPRTIQVMMPVRGIPRAWVEVEFLLTARRSEDAAFGDLAAVYREL